MTTPTPAERARELAERVADTFITQFPYKDTPETHRKIKEVVLHELHLEELLRDRDYYKWRLSIMMPLFEEARDALPTISTVSARLHNVSLSLADRMDKAGTATRADFNSAIAQQSKGPQ